jgi:hypothetical protein
MPRPEQHERDRESHHIMSAKAASKWVEERRADREVKEREREREQGGSGKSTFGPQLYATQCKTKIFNIGDQP